MSRPNSQAIPPPTPELASDLIAPYEPSKQTRCMMASNIVAGLMTSKYYAKFDSEDLTRMALDYVDKIVKLA